MAINNVLKDKNDNILNSKIPRYEMLKYDLTDDANPVKTGRKVNGKDEYVKRITISSFPNATSVSYSTGITNANLVRSFIYMKTSSSLYLLPYVSPDTTNPSVIGSVRNDASELTIRAGTDRSNLSGFAEIYFTYNS